MRRRAEGRTVGAAVNQELGAREVAVLQGPVECRGAVGLRQVDVGARVQERGHDGDEPLLRRNDQRTRRDLRLAGDGRLGCGGTAVRVGARGQQDLDVAQHAQVGCRNAHTG